MLKHYSCVFCLFRVQWRVCHSMHTYTLCLHARIYRCMFNGWILELCNWTESILNWFKAVKYGDSSLIMSWLCWSRHCVFLGLHPQMNIKTTTTTNEKNEKHQWALSDSDRGTNCQFTQTRKELFNSFIKMSIFVFYTINCGFSGCCTHRAVSTNTTRGVINGCFS